MTSNLSRPTLEANLATARQNGDAATEAACLIALGDIAKESEEYDLAQGLYGQAWAAYEKAGDQRGIATMMRYIAGILVTRRSVPDNRVTESMILCLLDEALAIFASLNDLSGQGHVWKVRGSYFRQMGSDDRGFARDEAWYKAKQCFEQAHDEAGEAELFLELMRDSLFEIKEKDQKYLIYFQKAQKHEYQLWIVYYFAWTAHHKGDKTLAEFYREQTITLFDQWADKLKDFHSYGVLRYVTFFNDTSRYAFLRQMLTVANNLPPEPEREINTILKDMALLAKKLKDYTAAQDYLESIVARWDSANRRNWNLEGHAQDLFELAEVRTLRGDMTEGRQYYRMAIDLNQQLTANYNTQKMHFWYRWGKIEYAVGDPEIGCSLCHQAFVLAQAIFFGDRRLIDTWQQELAAMNCPPPDSETSYDS